MDNEGEGENLVEGRLTDGQTDGQVDTGTKAFTLSRFQKLKPTALIIDDDVDNGY